MAEIPMPIMDVPGCWLGAAFSTLDAPRWKVALARWFGRRFTGEDTHNGVTKTIVGYEWRGKLYLTDYRDSL